MHEHVYTCISNVKFSFHFLKIIVITKVCEYKMFRTYSDMSFMIKIQRYFIEIRWKIAIEIISSTIVDIKFSPVFKLFIIFREEIEEKKTNKVENKEESRKPLVEDEDRYLHLSYGVENFHNDICTYTQVLNEYYWVWI